MSYPRLRCRLMILSITLVTNGKKSYEQTQYHRTIIDGFDFTICSVMLIAWQMIYPDNRVDTHRGQRMGGSQSLTLNARSPRPMRATRRMRATRSKAGEKLDPLLFSVSGTKTSRQISTIEMPTMTISNQFQKLLFNGNTKCLRKPMA